MSAPAERPRRLFLAFWPDAAIRARMAALSRELPGGRRVAPDHLHLTLVFLGATAGDRLNCYERALADLPVPAMTLTLDRIGCWPRSGIVWLGTGAMPAALLALVNELHRRLQTCGFQPERRPFQVHVTLARKFSGILNITALPEPVVWPMDRIALVESQAANGRVCYQVLREWPTGDT